MACSQWRVSRQEALKDANTAYGARTTRRGTKYEEALSPTRSSLAAYFYLANSYDNLYRPAGRARPQNDAVPEQGDRELQAGVRDESEDPKLKKLSLEYLVAAYGLTS